MASPARVAGVCFLKRDGLQYALRGSLKVNFSSLTREGVVGQDGVHGYKETPVIPSIEGEITDLGGLSLTGLQAVRDSTLTAELANGKTYLLFGAWFAGEIALDTAEGKVPVKFEGLGIREVLAA